MAVKQHVSEVDERSDVQPVELEQIIQTIELIRQSRSDLLIGSNLVTLFETIVHCLAHVHNPRETGVARFLENIHVVQNFFKDTCENLPNLLREQVISACLKKLYYVLSKADSSEPCAAVSIILTLVEPNVVPGAVAWLLRENPGDDDTLIRILRRLFMWLRYCNYTPCLSDWTVTFMKGLQDQCRWDVMLNASSMVIENLLAGLVMPLFRSTIAPVVEHMLTTVLHTSLLLRKILPRLMFVLNHLSREDSVSSNATRQRLIDIVAALFEVFPNEVEGHEDVVSFLRNMGPSADYRKVLRCNTSLNVVRLSTGGSGKVGLNNLGNTCYMNSVLQALFMTRQFYSQVILSSKEGKCGAVMEQLAYLFTLLSYSNRPYISPKAILQKARPPGFTPGQYHDSSEFLVYLLDTLHEQEKQIVMPPENTENTENTKNEAITTPTKVESNTVDALKDNIGKISQKSMNKRRTRMNDWPYNKASHLTKFSVDENKTASTSTDFMETDDKYCEEKEKSIDKAVVESPKSESDEASNIELKTITQTCFNGLMLTCYECMSCRLRSNNNDTFRDLQLAFPDSAMAPGENFFSVQWLLDYYLSKEKLQGANKYSCEKCKALCDAERSIIVMSAPQNLILTLKHFRYDPILHQRKKLSHRMLHNEKVYLFENNNSVKVFYMLYAAVIHDGVNMDSGHYYTYAMDKHKHWYKFNDSVVSDASFDDLDNMNPYNTPYILFYKKVGTQNIGLKKVEQIDIDSPKKLRLGETTTEEETSTEILHCDMQKNDINNDVFTVTHGSDGSEIEFEDLPIHLQNIVRHDNKCYEDEIEYNKTLNSNKNTQSFFNDKSESDNEDDSASGCGGSGVISDANRYVF